MKYEAIIFDLDGVICYTDKFHYEAWKTIADALHIPFDEEVNKRLRGVSRLESFQIILEGYNGHSMTKEMQDKYIDEKNQIYRKLLKNISLEDIAEDVCPTLDTLKSKGLKLGIGSSSKNATYILQRLGLTHYFDAVVTGIDILHSKPQPDVFLMAAERLGTLPEKCLVVEDAQAGVEAAYRAAMDCATLGDAALHPKAAYRLKSIKDLLLI